MSWLGSRIWGIELTADLQKQLNKIGSNVQLSHTVSGEIPTEYAFIKGDGRKFHAEFASSRFEFSVQLNEDIPSLKYYHCFARAVIKDINKLTRLVDLWVDKVMDIEKLAIEFPELELFKPFSVIHSNPEIEAAWIGVKRQIFRRSNFWDNKDWDDSYQMLLVCAKKHKSFENYFPLTSHYSLRFSLDKEKKETWPFYYNIVPTHKSEKYKGDFCVEVSMKHADAKYFDDVNTALDFYADLLLKTKTHKWV